MVRLRLTRRGAKKRPFYRVVAADQRAPRDGRFIEQLGFYDPMQDPKKIELKLDRVDFWLGQGAQATETVTALIAKYRTAEEA
jgi:small subunit ribosomal protein S16